MSKPENWIKHLKHDPLPVLLKKAPLPVRYATVLRFSPDNEELLFKLKSDLEQYQPRVHLLETQQPDGLWEVTKKYGIEERNRAMSFLLQLQNMTKLLDFGCTREMPAIQQGIIGLLKTQKPDGKFPLLLHHHGYALWLLAKYELVGNPFVEKGYRWLAKRQRDDGGWISSSIIPAGTSLQTVKSGIWTTLMILHAFSVHSRLKHSEVSHAAAKFLLDNYLVQNHTTLFSEPDAWDYLYNDYSEDGLFRGGTLRFIEALAPLADFHDHPNFKKAIKWLLDQQLPSGLFPAIVGKSKGGDYGVTLRFYAALKEIERLRT